MTALTGGFGFGAPFDLAEAFDAVLPPAPPLPPAARRLPPAALLRVGARLAAGASFAVGASFAAGADFLFVAFFRARFFAVDLPFVAAGDLRAGFTCFFTMIVLVR
ncbi:MAG TPA: hypothetical protein VF059_03920 [Casimicrobiaceae bacterium]